MSTGAILLVDGMSVLKTVAGPVAGLNNGYAYSFLVQLTAAVKKLKPISVIVCWEGGLGGRQEIYPAYKGERSASSDVLCEQRQKLQELLTHLGVEQAMCPGYEADDVIASLANTLPAPVVIFSNDKDFLQLVGARVHVYQKPRVAGSKTREIITLANFQRNTGYENPTKWALAQFALGDGVDGVPKVTGATPAKVHSFLHHMHMGEIARVKMDYIINGNHPEFLRNKALMDLRDVKDLDQPLQITYGKLSAESTIRVLYELGFASIVAKFHDWFQAYEGSSHADVSD